MQLPTDRRTWIAGAGGAAALIAVASWFLLISPELAAADDANSQAESSRAQNTVLTIKADALKKQTARIGVYTKQLEKALEALPYDSGLPAFTRQVTAQAQRSNVTLQSVNVGGITAVAATTPAATTPTSATSTPASADATASTAPTTTTTAGDNAAGGLFSVSVTLSTTGPMADQLAFVKRVQYEGPRRALVTGVQYSGGSNGAPTTGSVQLTVFSAPQSPEQIALFDKMLAGDTGH